MVELSLEQYREQLAIQREVGAELERERIIELLEPYVKYADEFADAISLIKGEKNG